MKAIIVLKGTEGGGKSTIAKRISSGYKVKEVGRFTAHALDYSDLDDYEVLYLKEFGKMDDEKFGVSTLKFLSADDEGYVVEYVVRDEEIGRLRTESNRIPPITVITTTTRLSLEPQFERRAWLSNVDESPEMTKEILTWKAKIEKQESEKSLGLRKITDYEFSKEVIRRFSSQIKPQNIIIPFPNTIVKMFNQETLRLRGDMDKIYTFVKLYGLFNLKRLWKLNDRVYAVTPVVAVEGLDIIRNIISKMLTRIETRTKEILEALNEIEVNSGMYTNPRFTGEEALQIRVRPNKKGSKIDKDVRATLAVKLNISEDTIRKRFNALCRNGYLGSDDGKGRSGKTYTLLYDVDEILEKLEEKSGILKSPDSLMPEMEKEARDFLKTECGVQLEREESENSYVAECKEISNTGIPESVPHSDSNDNQGDSGKKTIENAENRQSSISEEKSCNNRHLKPRKDWCPICGRSIHISLRKLRLPPWKDEVYAHECCYRERHVEGKPWWEYATEREMREAIGNKGNPTK